MKRLFCAALLALLMVFSCTTAKKKPAAAGEYRKLAPVSVPAMYNTAEGRMDYILSHYWDPFFSADGATDSSAILGVKTVEVEQCLSNYISLIQRAPLEKAQESVSDLFRRIESRQEADTSSMFYPKMTELVAKYLYDPNSPLRDEDLFLPFVRRLADSPCTAENLRPGYEYQARMCSLNRRGEKVPDVKFKDIRGRKGNLYSIRAEKCIMFFTNPGCKSCKDIIGQLTSFPALDSLIDSRAVAVVNIYIDREIDKWREYEPNYPRKWKTVYDYNFTIRDSQNYDIRAIPSLYLLDAEKRVILKDAPVERVLACLSANI